MTTLQSRVAASALAVATVLAAPAARAAGASVVTLDEAWTQALATNERIRAADADRDRAAVAPWRAYSAIAPSIRELGSFTREKEEIAFPTGGVTIPGFNPVIVAQDVLRSSLEVGQPLYTHQFWGLRDIGRAEVARSDDAYRAARADVLLAVAAAYYDSLHALSLVGVARAAQAMSDVEIGHAEALVRAGEAVRSDVLRAQTERAHADERLAGAEGELDTATDRLRRLAGLQGDLTLVEPPARHVDLRSADPYVATAATHNPDLQQREQALAAARGEERRRVGALYPTLGVRFDYQSLNHESLADQNDFWTLILGAQLPLFESGGARWLDVAEQRAVVERLEAEVAGFRRDLAVDVRHAWITVRTLEAKRAAAEKALGLATESYRMLSDQYAAGTVTNLDVLSALNTLDDTRANLAAIRFAHAVACVQLERVTGTLGESENDR